MMPDAFLYLVAFQLVITGVLIGVVVMLVKKKD